MLSPEFQKCALLANEFSEVKVRQIIAVACVSEIPFDSPRGVPKVKLCQVVLEHKTALLPLFASRRKRWKKHALLLGSSTGGTERIASPSSPGSPIACDGANPTRTQLTRTVCIVTQVASELIAGELTTHRFALCRIALLDGFEVPSLGNSVGFLCLDTDRKARNRCASACAKNAGETQ